MDFLFISEGYSPSPSGGWWLPSSLSLQRSWSCTSHRRTAWTPRVTSKAWCPSWRRSFPGGPRRSVSWKWWEHGTCGRTSWCCVWTRESPEGHICARGQGGAGKESCQRRGHRALLLPNRTLNHGCAGPSGLSRAPLFANGSWVSPISLSGLPNWWSEGYSTGRYGPHPQSQGS